MGKKQGFDIFTREKRSQVMSRIRARGNRDTELRLIALLRVHRISGWRRNRAVFGKPDFVFPKSRVAVFVDGCFWHRHPGCKLAYTPKSRVEFWLRKFDNNVARDKLVTRTLRKAGWKIVRVWECELHRTGWPKIARRIARLRTKRQTAMLEP
jgi:DNA mismatch endonuclease (patch repair protein)